MHVLFDLITDILLRKTEESKYKFKYFKKERKEVHLITCGDGKMVYLFFLKKPSKGRNKGKNGTETWIKKFLLILINV